MTTVGLPAPLSVPVPPPADVSADVSADPLAGLPRLAAAWVFAYGSLIWNPEFAWAERHRVRIHGYHRAFCIRSTRYRGTPQTPGVVLGLDRGGSCHGIVYRLPDGEAVAIVESLYRREMPDRVYAPRLLPFRLPDGRAAGALAFVARRDHPSYLRLPRSELLHRLATCHGGRGPNRDYAINTWQALQAWGIEDAGLAALIRELDGNPLPSPALPSSGFFSSPSGELPAGAIIGRRGPASGAASPFRTRPVQARPAQSHHPAFSKVSPVASPVPASPPAAAAPSPGSPASPRTGSLDRIPVVDLGHSLDPASEASRRAARQLHEALSEIGFAYLAGHTVPEAVREAAFAASREFHASPLEKKQSIAIDANHRGYMGMATSTIVTSSVARVTRPNLSESLMLMDEVPADDPDVRAGKPLRGPNQWPDWLPGFRTTIEAYIREVDAVARHVVRLIALSLGLPATALDRHFEKPTTFLRLLHYPPQPVEADAEQFGSAPHTDYGIITMLAQDDSGGLQVRPKGRDWIEAPPIPGTYVLNVADMLARWTNHRYVSTPHRVINRSGGDRYSLPYFFDADMDAMIEVLPACLAPGETPRYPPVRYGDYLMERLNKNYQYRSGPPPPRSSR